MTEEPCTVLNLWKHGGRTKQPHSQCGRRQGRTLGSVKACGYQEYAIGAPLPIGAHLDFDLTSG